MTISVVVTETNINASVTQLSNSVALTETSINASVTQTPISVGVTTSPISASVVAASPISVSVTQTNISASISGGGGSGGVTDHALLTNLDYASAGHTGFQASLGFTPVNKSGDILSGDLIGTDFVKTRSGTITRVGGYISQVAKTGGRTLTISRSGGYINSISDGVRTWAFTRDGNNQITSWSVT